MFKPIAWPASSFDRLDQSLCMLHAQQVLVLQAIGAFQQWICTRGAGATDVRAGHEV
jgi:hypothetical protein